MSDVKSPIISQPESTNNGLSENKPSVQNHFRPHNCPPGLEYLLEIDQLLVQQKIELLETYTGCKTHNQYSVNNTMGQQVFFAKEDRNLCAMFWCGSCRPFHLRLFSSHSNREVLHIRRPLGCVDSCFPCCLQYMEVESPPGNLIGFVEQDFSCCYPKFSIKNAANECVLRIEGPLCTFSLLFNDIEFPIYSVHGNKLEIGRITKQWSGLVREVFTNADNFGVIFPIDLDVTIKACLLAAVFLIDFTYFEI